MFANARLKIDRANKHIADLEAIIRTLPSRYTSTLKIDHKAGVQSITYALSDAQPLIRTMALITGDAVHNIKTALDYAWIGAVSQIPSFRIDNSTKFPIFSKVEDLKRSLRKIEIPTASPALFEWVMEVAKPYRGGNDFVFGLHKLDITDKHRLLLPLAIDIYIKGLIVEDNGGEPVRGDSFAYRGWNPFHIYFFLHNKVKNKGQPSPSIVFDDGLPLQGHQVLGTLTIFTRLVLDLVQRLDGIRV